MMANQIIETIEKLDKLYNELAILELQLEEYDQKTLILEQIIKLEEEISFIEKELL